MTRNNTITSNVVPDSERVELTADLFGVHFPMKLEPYIYAVASNLAKEYRGGYWQFFRLDNGGFYMSPLTDKDFEVACDNGYEGRLSADALGITACLYAYSHLSFVGESVFDELCAVQFHLLREYALDHPEVRGIMAAID
jgi:hypothetical protein